MGIGLLELVVIAVAALVLLGPQRLPEILRQVGKFYVQLRRTSSEFRGVFDHVVRQAEDELRLQEIKRLTELSLQQTEGRPDTSPAAAPHAALMPPPQAPLVTPTPAARSSSAASFDHEIDTAPPSAETSRAATKPESQP